MRFKSALIICFGSLSSSISSKGALGKCNNLFKFVESVMKERVIQRPSIADAVDFDAGSSLYQGGVQIDAELRKRRAD